MKKLVAGCLALFLVACSNDAPGVLNQLSASSAPRFDATPDVVVLPAVTFTRTTGQPRTDVVTFSVPSGLSATLHLSSSSTQGINATVTHNGPEIFQATSGSALPANLVLQYSASNTVTVRLTGKPGSNITLSVTVPAPLERRVLFSSDRNSAGTHQIFAMSLDGANLIQLTNTSGNSFNPRYSPDRSRIAFSSDRDGPRSVYVMNADGSNVMRCTNSVFDDLPEWSPDGSMIAFTSKRDGINQIYVMNSDGTNQVRISDLSNHDYDASWSPDGSRFVFARSSPSASPQDVMTMNTDGSNLVQLTSNTGVNYTPRWSPNGQQIVFTSDRSNGQNVWLMNADGSGQVQLTNAPYSYRSIFVADGASLIFASNRTGVYQLYRIDLATLATTQLTAPPSGESYSPEYK